MSSVRERLERGAGIIPEATTAPAVPAVPAVIEQDPSMPEVPTVAVPTTALHPEVPAAVVAPVVEPPAVVVPPAPVEKRHTWQPTDENGKPMGGLQVIVYTTEQELIEKMQNNNVLLQRQLRKERREKAVGVEEKVDDAEKFTGVTEFKPRELTADERFKIAQGLVNPETFADARDQLVESAFGAKPAQVASTLNEVQRMIIRQRAVENYVDFVNTTGFNDTPENRATITGWLGKRNLAPTLANFKIAQNRLLDAGLLQDAPVVHQETPVVTPAPAAPVAAPAVATVVEEPKPQVPTPAPPALVETPESQAKRHSHVPSGLTPSVASAAGVSLPVNGASMTLADVDKLSADEYKRRMKDPSFVKMVNQLEEDAAKRRRARTVGQ